MKQQSEESKKIKIVFFGTPEFAATILTGLIEESGFSVAVVFSQPDKKVGRKQKIVFSPVKQAAQSFGIKVYQPENLKDGSVAQEIKEINPDIAIVAAYGKILPKEILALPRFGCVNVHASLLPKYRGASPIQHAILAGDKETGVTLMLMNEKMDEGNILAQEKVVIEKVDTTETLERKIAERSVKMIINFAPRWIAGKGNPQKQNESEATYCRKIKKEDGKIDWSQPAKEIFRKWRAFQPWPGIYTFFKEKNRVFRIALTNISADEAAATGENSGKVVEYNKKIGVQTGKGIVVIESVRPEGKKKMTIGEFLAGHKDFLGSYLGDENGKTKNT
jgi:methionyl-tRNA formyltransferase